MRIRIAVADQSEALFYEADRIDVPLQLIGHLTDPKARLHDRDFKSDRPGRVFDHAPVAGQRRGSVAHHGTGGERRPRKHETLLFARRIGHELETALRQGGFDRLILMAPPELLGVLRTTLPKSVSATLIAEVPKSLVHEPESAVRSHVPPRPFEPVHA